MTTSFFFICHNEKIRIPLIFFLLFLTNTLSGQIRYTEGTPLPQGIEKTSFSGTSVDYFRELPDLNVDSILIESELYNKKVDGLKFAHTFFTDYSPENAGINFTTINGIHTWKLGVRSNGAYSIGLYFDRFDIPKSGQLYVYNQDRSVVLGPFTHKNSSPSKDFMTSPIPGDEIIVEYQQPSSETQHPSIHLSEVKHDYLGMTNRSSPRFNSINLPCIPDVGCETALDTIKRSICLLIVNGDTYCTGTFVNNTACDGKIYMLTASHCLDNLAENGSRVVAFLNYESPHCDNRIRGPEEFSMSGSICRAINNDLDFALIEFLETPPKDYRIHLSGWSVNSNASMNAPFTCIQHPNGDIKKYAEEMDPLMISDADTLNTYQNEHWYVRYWETGHTWSGSSGAGLFDKNNRVIGLMLKGLSGGDAGCNFYDFGDIFNRLESCWDANSDITKQLKHWLAPNSETSGFPTEIDGMDLHAQENIRRISNLSNTDSLTNFRLQTGWGSPIGHNYINIKHIAERFTLSDSSMLLGVSLITAKGMNDHDKPIYIHVFDNNQGHPGDLICREVFNPTYIELNGNDFDTKQKKYYYNRDNYHRFSKPVPVGHSFYIGIEISYPLTSSMDTFQLYGTMKNASYNTAFYLQNRAWHPFTSLPEWGQAIHMGIEPIVRSLMSYDNPNNRDSTSILIQKPILFWSRVYQTLTLQLPPDWQGVTSLDIVDLYGRTIKRAQIASRQTLFDLHGEVPQFYIITLTNGSKKHVQKIAIGYQ